jgi:hypothetical protein
MVGGTQKFVILVGRFVASSMAWVNRGLGAIVVRARDPSLDTCLGQLPGLVNGSVGLSFRGPIPCCCAMPDIWVGRILTPVFILAPELLVALGALGPLCPVVLYHMTRDVTSATKSLTTDLAARSLMLRECILSRRVFWTGWVAG